MLLPHATARARPTPNDVTEFKAQAMQLSSHQLRRAGTCLSLPVLRGHAAQTQVVQTQIHLGGQVPDTEHRVPDSQRSLQSVLRENPCQAEPIHWPAVIFQIVRAVVEQLPRSHALARFNINTHVTINIIDINVHMNNI